MIGYSKQIFKKALFERLGMHHDTGSKQRAGKLEGPSFRQRSLKYIDSVNWALYDLLYSNSLLRIARHRSYNNSLKKQPHLGLNVKPKWIAVY